VEQGTEDGAAYAGVGVADQKLRLGRGIGSPLENAPENLFHFGFPFILPAFAVSERFNKIGADALMAIAHDTVEPRHAV
jgi:hypothetical protein